MEKEFSKIRPELENYKFPSEILSNKILDNSLNPYRGLKIRNAIKNEDKSIFNYLVPWTFDNLKKIIMIICLLKLHLSMSII